MAPKRQQVATPVPSSVNSSQPAAPLSGPNKVKKVKAEKQASGQKKDGHQVEENGEASGQANGEGAVQGNGQSSDEQGIQQGTPGKSNVGTPAHKEELVPGSSTSGAPSGQEEVQAGFTSGAQGGLEPVQLTFKDQEGNEVTYKVKRRTLMEKVLEIYCKKFGREMGSFRVFYDGKRVQPKDTADTAGLPNGAILDVHTYQISGGCRCAVEEW